MNCAPWFAAGAAGHLLVDVLLWIGVFVLGLRAGRCQHGHGLFRIFRRQSHG
jgi:hypothetical protein